MGKRIEGALTLMAGLAMKRAVNWPFDYMLYPTALVYFGTVMGGAAMIGLALITNLLVIRAYDWSRRDWLMIEKAKELQDQAASTRWYSRLLALVKRSKVGMFFVLCLDDPITVTLYFREGSHQYNGMSHRDWKIYVAANIVSNMYWIVGWTAVIEGFKQLVGILRS